MFVRLDQVLDKVSQQEGQDIAIDDTLATDDAGKGSCFGLCKDTKKSDIDRKELETDQLEAEQPELTSKTGEQVAMAKQRANIALKTLEELELSVQDAVFKQQDQQSLILKSCDDIMTWTSTSIKTQ